MTGAASSSPSTPPNNASTTAALAEWTLHEFVPRESADRAARRAVLDWLVSSIAGGQTPPALSAMLATSDARGAPRATVLADGGRGSASQAAFLNALASHVLELDDLHQPSTLHPGSAVVAAALAVAERQGSSGDEFLRAVTVGYENACRIGAAVNPEHYRLWHPTGTVNTFGAAAASAVLQDLSRDAFLNALGTAGTMAAGLWQFLPDGAMSKHLHPAHAAQAGILAADLAREGFTGASRILEGRQGFFAATVGEDRSDRALAGLGEDALAVEQTSFKLYPCCGHTHTGIDIARELAPALKGQEVDRVDVYTYGAAVQVVDTPDPQTPYQAKFSYPYVVACALVNGVVDGASFESASLGNSSIRDVMRRVNVHHEATLDEVYPEAYPARIEILTRSGRKLVAERTHATGTPDDPASDEELASKARSILGDDAAGYCSQFVKQLHERVIDTAPLVLAVNAYRAKRAGNVSTSQNLPRSLHVKEDGEQ